MHTMNLSKLATTFLLLVALLSSISPRVISASNPYQESYPPPGSETVPLPTVETLQPGTVDQSYPSIQVGSGGQTPLPIGVDTGSQSPVNDGGEDMPSSQSFSGTGDRGLLFLWVGFLATSLVFLICIFGSTTLFTRRNNS